MQKFTPSARLSDSENSELELFESLLVVGPLSDASEVRYRELVKKAHRRSKLVNPFEN